MSKQTRKPQKKARQESAKVHFDSTGKNMTSKAGLIPVVKFLDKLQQFRVSTFTLGIGRSGFLLSKASLSS